MKSILHNSAIKTLKQHNIEKLIIAGAMSHVCIDAVTRAAADFGYECHVHHAFMAALSFAYCNVDSTE
jgi:nicotinamidase-related amidase